MECILDRSHFSGTDLDRDIVSYAEAVYMYRGDEEIEWDDSERWQYEAEDALIWMDTIEYDNNKYFLVEDNSLFLVGFEEE